MVYLYNRVVVSISKTFSEVVVNHTKKPTFHTIALDLKKEAPGLGDRILLSLIFLVASVYLPLLVAFPMPSEAKEAFSLLVCALSILAQARLSKKISGGIGHAILLLLVGFLFGGPYIAAALGSLVSVACIFCKLALTATSLLPITFPMVAYVGATIAVGSPFVGALSLAGMPMALFLLLSVRMLLPKVRALCLISFGIGLSATIAAILYFLLAHNGINMPLLQEGVESLRHLLANELDIRLALLEGEVGVLPMEIGREDYARTLANEVINHLPAILILLCNGIALVTHSSMVRILLSGKIQKEPLAPMAIFDMSAVSAVVFLVSLLLSLVMNSPDSAMAVAACENLYLILIPGMLITLWMVLNAFLLAKSPSCFGILLFLAIPFLFFQFSSALLPIGAVIGAILILVAKIRKKLRQKKS